MKILALVTEAYGGRGGIAQSNRDLLEALAAAPAATLVRVVPRLATDGFTAPAKIRQTRPVRGRIAYAASAALAAAAAGPFALVFCGHAFMAPLAALVAAASGAPLWIHVHGIEAWDAPGAAVRRAFERASLVTAVSRYTRARLLEWSRLAPERVRVLPDTVEERFTPGPKPPALLRHYGLEGKKVLMTVGRMHPAERYKGHEELLRALPEILRRQPRTVYVIAGEGADRARLESVARDAGVSGSVVFAGRVENALLPEFYRMADAFAMPSRGEGFGIVFLEAAACGVPVVGGDRDGSRDALRDGRLGTMVDPSDPHALAAAVAEALSAAPDARIAAETRVFSKENFGPHARALMAFALGQKMGKTP